MEAVLMICGNGTEMHIIRRRLKTKPWGWHNSGNGICDICLVLYTPNLVLILFILYSNKSGSYYYCIQHQDENIHTFEANDCLSMFAFFIIFVCTIIVKYTVLPHLNALLVGMKTAMRCQALWSCWPAWECTRLLWHRLHTHTYISVAQKDTA